MTIPNVFISRLEKLAVVERLGTRLSSRYRCREVTVSGGSTVFFMYQSILKLPMYPLPAKCWHLAFLKYFGQIPKYVGSRDDRMPHQPATIQKFSHVSNRLFKCK